MMQATRTIEGGWRYQLGALAHWLVRFRGRQMADWLFSGIKAPAVLNRPFAGATLYLDASRSVLHQLLYLDGERLIHERHLLAELVRPGMHVVDVGANIGYFTLLFERLVGPAGHITAIEPSPENLVELKRNIENNHLSNVDLHECAVGKTDGRVALQAGINSGIVDDPKAPYTAEIHPLDRLISRPVDFVKIDVDGYEGLVLEGSREVLLKNRPTLLLEFHPLLVSRFGASFQSVLKFLSEIYPSVEFFDVPDAMTWWQKLRVQYFHYDSVRRFDPGSIPESQMHRGRQFGTFWIVCRSDKHEARTGVATSGIEGSLVSSKDMR